MLTYHYLSLPTIYYSLILEKGDPNYPEFDLRYQFFHIPHNQLFILRSSNFDFNRGLKRHRKCVTLILHNDESYDPFPFVFFFALNCGNDLGITDDAFEDLEVSKEFDLVASSGGKDFGMFVDLEVSTEHDLDISVGCFEEKMDVFGESIEFLSQESSVVSNPSLRTAWSTASQTAGIEINNVKIIFVFL